MIKCPFCGYTAKSLEDAATHLLGKHKDIVKDYAVKKTGKATRRSLRRVAFCLAQFGFQEDKSCNIASDSSL